MADKRMFAKSIVLSDIFLDMPMSARCLYFTLGMLADDDGFIGNVKSIMRQCGATNDDLNILLLKRYVLGFENGIIVIKHWRINNYLRNDRYKETTYLEEKSQLFIDEKGAYTDHDKTLGIPSIDKISIDKISIDKNIEEKTTKHQYGTYKNVLLSDNELETLKNEFDDWEERIERVSEYCASKGKSYKNYLATIRSWSRKEKPKHEDTLPTYDTSNNPDVDMSRLDEILRKRENNGSQK